jgi:hypothetical protein
LLRSSARALKNERLTAFERLRTIFSNRPRKCSCSGWLPAMRRLSMSEEQMTPSVRASVTASSAVRRLEPS